jgi:hypothetical protein
VTVRGLTNLMAGCGIDILPTVIAASRIYVSPFRELAADALSAHARQQLLSRRLWEVS